MHPALLVDEILQLIFESLSDLSTEEQQWTYAQLARCCTAWKSPALALLWMHLHGMEPVLSVLRSCEDATLSDARARVLQYTMLVKSIAYLREPTMPDALEHCAVVFPQLETVVLNSQGCMVPYALATSPSLKRVTINTGFPAGMRSIDEHIKRSNAAALFLLHALTQAPHICALHIHGRISLKLDFAIASYTQLRSLSVRATWLRVETFAAIAVFPKLEILDLSVLLWPNEVLCGVTPSPSVFPALRSLSIRAYGPVVEAIIVRLPVGVLTKLHLEMETYMEGPAYMKDVFKPLVERTSDSLRELQVKDRTRPDHLQILGITQWYDLGLLGPLSGLKQLRRFTLHDPDFTDADIEVISKWWPLLEHLDLGTYDPTASVTGQKARLTPAAHSLALRSEEYTM